jgi:hypothetical protein
VAGESFIEVPGQLTSKGHLVCPGCGWMWKDVAQDTYGLVCTKCSVKSHEKKKLILVLNPANGKE